MTVRSYEPGDVRVKDITIVSSKSIGARASILDQVISVDIFEDMSKPTMYATIVMLDTLGLLEKFPIMGEEEIEITIKTPGIYIPTEYKFRCFEVSNMQRIPNGKGTSYTLRCTSIEHLFNGGSVVGASFDTVISDMVPHILNRYLSSSKPVICDPTRGSQQITIPKLPPFQAIDMLRQRAISAQYVSSSYVFFENQAGFNFKTIEGLYKDGLPQIGARVYNIQDNPNADEAARTKEFRTIKSHQIIKRSDSVRKTTQGAFRSVTRVFDIATKKFETINYDVKKSFPMFSTAAGKLMSNTDEHVDQFAGTTPRQFLGIRDGSRPDNFITENIGVRNSFVELINDDLTRILIHGDTGLKIGDVIRLDLPRIDGLTARRTPDRLMAGNYLVVRLRHMITLSVKATHEMVIDCVKMGV